jgi:hypothetical protein
MFATLGFNELVRVPSGMERTFAGLRSWLDRGRGSAISRLAGHLLRDRHGAQYDLDHGLSVGADAVEGGPARRCPDPGPHRAIRQGRLMRLALGLLRGGQRAVDGGQGLRRRDQRQRPQQEPLLP